MFDRMLSTVANEHRRRLLVALLEHNPQDEVPVPERAHGGERGLDALRNEMFHSHLPKLEDAGYVRWDRETHTVSKGPNFEEIRPLLELFREHAEDLPDDWI